MNLTDASKTLSAFFDSHHEWLLILPSGRSFALIKSEITTSVGKGGLHITFLNDGGIQKWRIAAYQQKTNEMVLDLTRQSDRQKVRFVPRIPAAELVESVELARLERANQIAGLLVTEVRWIKSGRVELNKENGRFAQIAFQLGRKSLVAIADVSDTATPELIITNAILWLTKWENRKSHPVGTIWILAENRMAGNLQKLHALLGGDWKQKLRIFEIPRDWVKDDSQENSKSLVVEKEVLRVRDLWRYRPTKLELAENVELNRTASEIIGLAPLEIDHLFTKQGETLRFRGLPFARVRRMFEREKSWFGIEREKRVLSENSREDFYKLIEDLKTYRQADSAFRRHEFYRLAPEAWLESILRRNIKRLDANLILSPIYNQFRASEDRIDLLAMRRDGRLIIIELKVSPNREMIFQAVDYWRKIELQRRRGILNKAKLFGDREIADKPTIVYLVAPTLAFHRDFRFLAKTISSEIEVYRFDLAENWRENVRVLRRERL